MGDKGALHLCECSEGASPLSHCPESTVLPGGPMTPPPSHKPQRYLVHRCTGDPELSASPGGLHGVFSLVMSGFPQERVAPVPLPPPADLARPQGRAAHLPQRLTQLPRPHCPWVVGAGGLTLPGGGPHSPRSPTLSKGAPHCPGGAHTAQGWPILPWGNPTLPKGAPYHLEGVPHFPEGAPHTA